MNNSIVTIYQPIGDIRATMRLGEGSVRTKNLEGVDDVVIRDSLDTRLDVHIGDYILLDEGRFVLCTNQTPTVNDSNGALDYSLRFEAPYHLWKNHIFKLNPTIGATEVSWSLTATLKQHMVVFLRNLEMLHQQEATAGYDHYNYRFDDGSQDGVSYTYSIVNNGKTPVVINGGVVDTAEPKLISYNNVSLFDALTMIAEAWKFEWWITDHYICFGRCENGTAVTFEEGDNVALMKPTSSKSDYATRIYGFGGTQNISGKYRKNLIFDVTNTGAGVFWDAARPMLPEYINGIDEYKTQTTLEPAYFQRYYYDTSTYSDVTISLQDGWYKASVFTWDGVLQIGDTAFTAPCDGSYRIHLKVNIKTTGQHSSPTTFPPIKSASLICGTSIPANKPYNPRNVTPEVVTETIHPADAGEITMSAVFDKTYTCTAGDIIPWMAQFGWTLPESVTSQDFGVEIQLEEAYIKPVEVYPVINGSITFVGDESPTAVTLEAENGVYKFHTNVTPKAKFTLTGDAYNRIAIPTSYYSSSSSDDNVLRGLADKRLLLPEAHPFVDVFEGMTPAEVVELAVVVDSIYPKQDLTVTFNGVEEPVYTSTTYDTDDAGNRIPRTETYYRFRTYVKNTTTPFMLPTAAVIADEFRVRFTSGSLAGMTFPCYIKDGEYYEVVQTEDYGTPLPNGDLHPNDGDGVIFIGWDTAYWSATDLDDVAEQQLYEYISQYASEIVLDTNDYDCTLHCDFAQTHSYDLGQKVTLLSPFYFTQEGRESRIIGFSHPLDLPFNNPVYTVGESGKASRLGEMERQIEGLEYTLSEVLANGVTANIGGRDIVIIKMGSSITPSDENVYSARRTDSMFLRKDSDDVANGSITFNNGLTSNGDVDVNGETNTENLLVENEAVFEGNVRSDNFEPGISGWGADRFGNLEVESLTSRSYIMTEEMLINRLQGQEGDTLFSDNDQIEAVESFIDETDGSTHYILTLKEKWEGYFTAQQVGNIVKGIVNTYAAKDAGVSDYTSAADLAYQDRDNGGNYFYTSYMQVVATHNTASQRLDTNQIEVVLYGDSEVPAQKNFPPCELMTIARRGCYLNPNDYPEGSAERQSIERRQRLFEISVTDGRIMKLTGVMSPILQQGNFGVTIGTLPEFVQRYPVVAERMADGDFLYAQGVVVGDFIKIDKVGTPIPQPIYPQVGWVSGQDLIDAGQTPTPGYGIYYANHWNEDTRQYETHYVTHRGVLWQCLQSQPVKSGNVYTYYEPKWNSPYWRLVDGNENITMEFDSSRGYSFRRGAVDTTITPYVFYGNVDITDDIANEFWLWTRESESGKTPQDSTWDAQHTGQRVLHLTNNDMPQTWSSSDKAIFTCTATINDGKTTRILNNQIIS